MLSGFEQRWNQLSCTSIKGGFRLQFSSLASVHLSSITKAADITLALENKLAYLSIALVLPFLAFWCCHSCHFWALCPFGSVLWQGLTVHYPRFFTLGRYSQWLLSCDSSSQDITWHSLMTALVLIAVTSKLSQLDTMMPYEYTVQQALNILQHVIRQPALVVFQLGHLSMWQCSALRSLVLSWNFSIPPWPARAWIKALLRFLLLLLKDDQKWSK